MAKNSKPTTDPAASQETPPEDKQPTTDPAASQDATGLATPKTDDELAAAQQADNRAADEKAATSKAAKERAAKQGAEESAAKETAAAQVAVEASYHRFALRNARPIGDENYLAGDVVGELRLPPGVSPNFFVSAIQDGLLTEVKAD